MKPPYEAFKKIWTAGFNWSEVCTFTVEKKTFRVWEASNTTFLPYPNPPSEGGGKPIAPPNPTPTPPIPTPPPLPDPTL